VLWLSPLTNAFVVQHQSLAHDFESFRQRVAWSFSVTRLEEQPQCRRWR
jgi:hypothetical protein